MKPHSPRTAGVGARLLVAAASVTLVAVGCATGAAPDGAASTTHVAASPLGASEPREPGAQAATAPATSAATAIPGPTPQPGAASPPSDATSGEIARLETLVRDRPDDADAYAQLGAAYLQRVREKGDPSDYGRAETAFDEALKQDAKNLDAIVGKGVLALARHEFRDALKFGEQAQRIAPNEARVYGVLGDAQIELGMYEEAVRTIQTMVDLRPNISSYSRVSYLRELHGDLDGAIDAMKDAFSSGAPAVENVEYVRVLIGNLFFQKGDLSTAERTYHASLGALPGYVFAQAGLARVRAAQARWDESIELYQKAIERIPLPEFVIALGETQEAAGRTADAAETYELVRVIQKLFAENGVDTDLELALFEADHGSDPAAAVELARAAYADQPNVRAADTLAWALRRAGRLEEAMRYAKEALRLGTKDALFLYHAGMIASEAGETKAAKRYLSAALQTNPHFSPLHAPLAKRALAELG